MTHNIGCIAVALALVACGSGTGNDNGGTGGGSAPITATVNGSAFTGNTSTIATRNSGVINMSAFNSGKTAEILLTVHADNPGTYSFGTGTDIAEYEMTTTTSASQWLTGYNGGTGSITFTTLTASGASGTFSFTGAALPNTGATGTASVTNGKFNVTF